MKTFNFMPSLLLFVGLLTNLLCLWDAKTEIIAIRHGFFMIMLVIFLTNNENKTR